MENSFSTVDFDPPPKNEGTPIAGPGLIIDTFPTGPLPDGWVKRPIVDGEGYALVSHDGVVLFSYRVEGHLCLVTAKIYASGGQVAAECVGNEFRIYTGPIKF